METNLMVHPEYANQRGRFLVNVLVHYRLFDWKRSREFFARIEGALLANGGCPDADAFIDVVNGLSYQCERSVMPPPSQPLVPPEQQEPLYAAIADELIALTPESWSSVVLDVTVETSPGGMLSMSHTIGSPEGHKRPIMVSDELSDLTHKLLTTFRQHGPGWTGLHFEVRQLRDGGWHYSCDLAYG
jgi:hypothetical protein